MLNTNNINIRQIQHNLDYTMIADYYNILSELQDIEKNIYDNKSTMQKLKLLQNILNRSVNRYEQRARAIPKLNFPQDLPISAKKQEIIDGIKNNQVIIITGETGSGKTTQIPKMCLAAGRGLRGLIGLTQPRRIAAVSIAQRIAAEIGELCGQSIAYKIRFEEKSSKEPLIKVMTDGILLAETINDRELLSYDTIIVDEAHERSLNIDFILGFLRPLLSKRKDLKLIITSATIDTSKFSHAFNKAPIIEVSGRMYPVEVRYQPVDPVKEEKGEITYIDEAVACVEKLQSDRRYDDILIFLPTEQDIREACDLLSKKCTGLVLPLYARLSGSQQRLVFSAAQQQKIIVATNIAETSLTIPGIKYVIDAGLARILDYNPRSQTTGLPIRPVSRSSAEQRKGRCGRVQNGICIRLYSSDDFSQRPLYTAPEIMRSNLAGVILRMLSLNLGSVTSFPFIDRPHPKSIRDGIDILRDLGAITKSENNEEENYQLTATGRLMSLFPLDPRISRILIEAQKEGCVNEVAIIAAALSIQDPRERPYDKTDLAAIAHARFQHAESDFLTYLKIWNQYHDSLENLPTQSKLRKFCRNHFLSYKRMIEWRDIYHQILGIIEGDKKPSKNKKNVNIDIDQNQSDKIHRCILSGYLSQIALKKEKNFYQAAKSREVMIYPGSGLFNRAGLWIVATEIAQTSRLFARNVANIKSEWLEEIGSDNCRYTYAAAHWEKNRGQVVALEKVTLFGLTIFEKRPVAYERINPEEAKQIFIREALLTGEVARKIPFLEHNLSLLDQANTIEDKLRKRGLVTDEETIARLYDQRLPLISDIRSLLKLIKEKESDKFLRFTIDDLLAAEPDAGEISQYPDHIKIEDTTFDCRYSFQPGKKDDGVTVKIPLGLISKASRVNIDRFLPKILQEKILHLLQSLPKSLRQKLPPPDQVAKLIFENKVDLAKPLPQTLSLFIQNQFRVTVPVDAWNIKILPEHLNVRYTVIDEKGEEVESSRNIEFLKQELSGKANMVIIDELRRSWEKENITCWDFADLPDKIPITGKHRLIGYAYPAIQTTDDSINLRLFTDQNQSEAFHLQGIAALYCMHFADKLKQLKKNMTLSGEMKTNAIKIGNHKLLEQSIIARVKADLFSRPWRSKKEFLDHASQVNSKTLQYGQHVLDLIEPVLKAFADTHILVQKLIANNIGNTPLLKFIKDTQEQMHSLVPVDFPLIYDFSRMKDLPRYLKALALRAQRGSLNLTSAQNKLQEVSVYSDQYFEMKKNIIPETTEDKKRKIEEFFWMIEEYKVSLFAQELKTRYPVSPKKLTKFIEEIQNTI